MAKEKNPLYGNKVRTGECFASFPHLAEVDKGRQFSDNKFKVDGIFTSKEAMAPLVAECKQLAKTNFGTTDDIHFPWKNGDEGSVSKFQGYPGHYYITPKTGEDKPPVVVGPAPKTNPADANGVFDRRKIYAGAIIKLNVTPKAYTMTDELIVEKADGSRVKEKVEKKGITLYLNAVQFVRDSERFGGGDDQTGGFDDEAVVETEDSDDLMDF